MEGVGICETCGTESVGSSGGMDGVECGEVYRGEKDYV